MMRRGEFFQCEMLEATTSATDYGSWPTPTANDGGNTTFPPAMFTRSQVIGEIMRREDGLQTRQRGRANPEWFEWLQGLPRGATGLNPLETPNVRQWWRQFGYNLKRG